MKNYVAAAAILSVSLLGGATKAADKAALKDSEYSLVQLELQLNVSADEAWKRMWPFCEIHHQMARAGMAGHECTIEVGHDGTDVGSERVVGGRTHEIITALSKYSYTYVVPGPNPLYHHSFFGVVPEGPNKSKFVRRWFWERKGTAEADTAELVKKLAVFTPVFVLQAKVAEGK